MRGRDFLSPDPLPKALDMRASRTVLTSLAVLAAVSCSRADTTSDTTGASAAAATPMEGTRQVASGGINAAGWSGRIDPGEARNGQKLENAKLEQRGDSILVTTGPAVVYWNPANTATGNYTVSATFTEPK